MIYDPVGPTLWNGSNSNTTPPSFGSLSKVYSPLPTRATSPVALVSGFTLHGHEFPSHLLPFL